MVKRLSGIIVIVVLLVALQAQLGPTQSNADEEDQTTEPGAFPTYIPTFDGPFNEPTTLPSGEWYMMANGRIFTLDLTVENHQVTDVVFSSGDIENANYDPQTHELTFERVLPTTRQYFTGYLFY